jgi:hypothetical protein
LAVTVEVSVHIDATRSRVWDEICDFPSQVEWMEDAVAIEYTGSKHEGIGTEFACTTQVWRLRTVDHMLVTEWTEGARMTVQHDGKVKGVGTFALSAPASGSGAADAHGTSVTWTENLTFPPLFGGVVGEVIARPLFVRMWQTNLASLKSRCEGDRHVDPIRYFGERGIELVMHHRHHEWTVDLVAPKIKNFNVKAYATGPSPYAARAAAMTRWQTEEEPS